jgi:hypothetical protein
MPPRHREWHRGSSGEFSFALTQAAYSSRLLKPLTQAGETSGQIQVLLKGGGDIDSTGALNCNRLLKIPGFHTSRYRPMP